MKPELSRQEAQEAFITGIIKDLPDETQADYKTVVQRLGLGFGHGLAIGAIAQEIAGKAGTAKLQEAYTKLIDLMYHNLEYTPQHTEIQSSEVIQDFHHYYSGSYGQETHEVIVTATWSLSYKGRQEVDKFVTVLKKDYGPQNKLQGLRRFFGR